MLNVVEAGGDTRFELINHQMGRVMSIGTNWTHLRIGMRFYFTDLGVNPVAAFLGVGVSAAPTAMFANGPLGTGAHFIGMSSTPDGSSPWTREAGYACYSGAITGTLITNGTASRSGGVALRYSANPSVRHAIVVDLEKSGANMVCEVVGPNSAEVPEATIMNDVSNINWLIEAMESGVAHTGVRDALNARTVASNYVASALVNRALDEATYGDLTAVCFCWNRNAFRLRVSELLWSKVA